MRKSVVIRRNSIREKNILCYEIKIKEGAYMDDTKALCILVTDEDKTGRDIAKMSNFFDGYITALSTQINSSTSIEAVHDLQVADIGIINEVLHHAEAITSGKYSFLPDFDSLPLDIRRKLRKGIYTVGESRQVEGNMRAVILDENGVRVKDITLKKVLNDPGSLETARNMANQMQLRQINAKLSVIQELQSYQLERDRDRDIIVPFLNARDYILRAQTVSSLEERNSNLSQAAKELTQAINSVYAEMQTTVKWLDRLTMFPIFQITPLIHRQINYLTQDLQLATKYVGVQMQVFDHLGSAESAMLELKKYRRVMDDFISLPVGRRNKTAISLMQDYSPYDAQNIDCWYNLANDMKPFLQLDDSSIEAVYLISAEDVHDEEAN